MCVSVFFYESPSTTVTEEADAAWVRVCVGEIVLGEARHVCALHAVQQVPVCTRAHIGEAGNATCRHVTAAHVQHR